MMWHHCRSPAGRVYFLVLQYSKKQSELDGVERFVIVDEGKAEWDLIIIGLLLKFADNVELVDGGESWPEASLFSWLMLV